MSGKWIALLLSLCVLSQARAQNSTATWGAYTSNGIGDASGNPLPNGSNDLTLLGTFKGLTNSQIAAMASNEAALMADFTTYTSSVVGALQINGPGSASDGYWLNTTQASTNALGIQNLEMYYVVFNAPTAGAASQYGIYTDPGNASWVFPTDNVAGNVSVTDLSDVPHNSSGILWGSFGTGTSRDLKSPLYNLANISSVPEPSTWAAAALAFGAVLSAAIRRNKRH